MSNLFLSSAPAYGAGMTETRPLHVRATPRQKRSRETFERILEAASELIHERGSDALKLTEVAVKADVPIGSVYRYFPNKAAIVHAIAEQHVEKMERALRERLQELNLSDAVDVLIDQFYEFYRHEPAYSAIWSGVEAMPELRELDLRELQHYGDITRITKPAMLQQNPVSNA